MPAAHDHLKSALIVAHDHQLVNVKTAAHDHASAFNMGLAHTIVGIVGNVISFGLFLSPVPTFYQIYKRKAVEEFQPYPYLCTVMNCIIWMFYGLPVVKKDNILVLTINSVGLVIELLYLTVYVVYANDRKKRLGVGCILLCEAASTVVIVLVALWPLYTHITLFVGITADVFNIIMYAAPLAIWRKVIETRSVEYMPFWLSLAGFSNGICWTVYGLLQFDIFILVSNGLGALFGFVQLALYAFFFFNGHRKTKDQVKQPPQLHLSHLPSGPSPSPSPLPA
ncbi:hypothetical protein V6N13_061800 [Hibiscus sabdariffa]